MSFFQKTQPKEKFETTSEKEKAASYWRNLRPGSILILRDVQSIELGVYKGIGSNGIDYKVEEVDYFTHLNSEGRNSGICEWIFAKLVRNDFPDIFLMIKSVKNIESECRIYYKPKISNDDDIESDLVPSGDRADIVNAGHSWIFIESVEDTPFNELNFTKEIKYSPDGEYEIVYTQKPFGPMFAKCIQNPSISENDLVSTIVEYKSNDETLNSEALFLEIGNPENEFGGNIVMYFGTPITLDDIDVLSF